MKPVLGDRCKHLSPHFDEPVVFLPAHVLDQCTFRFDVLIG